MIRGFKFGWWHVADRARQLLVVEPVNPGLAWLREMLEIWEEGAYTPRAFQTTTASKCTHS